MARNLVCWPKREFATNIKVAKTQEALSIWVTPVWGEETDKFKQRRRHGIGQVWYAPALYSAVTLVRCQSHYVVRRVAAKLATANAPNTPNTLPITNSVRFGLFEPPVSGSWPCDVLVALCPASSCTKGLPGRILLKVILLINQDRTAGARVAPRPAEAGAYPDRNSPRHESPRTSSSSVESDRDGRHGHPCRWICGRSSHGSISLQHHPVTFSQRHRL